MMHRLLGVGGFALVAILPLGCATKGFVREELQKSETKVAGEVGRVETGLGQERERINSIGVQVTETRSVAEDGVRRADRAAGIATEATARAEQAGGRATEAFSKAGATDERVTRLWKNRHARVPVETIFIRFGFDKADLDDRGQTALLDVAKQLRENAIVVVDLEGYTDNTGDSAYNVQLSQRRVEAVRRYLIEQGAEMPRINSVGLGPIMDKGDKAKNRRVTVKLMVATE